MTTDLIQSKLYEKADRETQQQVDAALHDLCRFSREHGSSLVVSNNGSRGKFVAKDGMPVLPDMPEEIRARAVSRMHEGRFETSLSWTIEALRSAMFKALQQKNREAFVNQFIEDVGRLKSDVEELSARVDQ
jgi:hypothetical protein